MSQETEISEITADTVVPFPKCCTFGKPRKSKKAQLEYFVSLQTWSVSGYLILAVYVIIKLLIIMLYYTNTINHFTAYFHYIFIRVPSELYSGLGLTAERYLIRFLISNS